MTKPAASNIVPFGSYTPEAAQRAKASINEAGASAFMKLKVGRNRIRILPGAVGKDSPFVEVWRHYIPSGESVVVVVCPRMTDKAKLACVVCDKSAEFRTSGREIDRKKGWSLRAQLRAMCNVINRDDPDGGVRIWEVPQSIYEWLSNVREDQDDPLDFSHPLKGCDIHIDREGSGIDTKYTPNLARRITPLAGEEKEPDVEQINTWLTDSNDLDQHKALPSDDDLLKALSGERPGQKPAALGSGDGGRGGNSRSARGAADRDDAPRRPRTIDTTVADDDDEDLPAGI